MNSKLMMFFVAMALSVGFMHHRYSKLNERMQLKAAADKARLAEAKFERLDFSPAAIDDDTKRGNVDACLQSKGRFFSYNIADNHWDDFCRCLSVHYVAHVFPLVEENCRAPGRIDFTEAGCALVDPKKPRQLEDRLVKIGEECSAWVKAEPSGRGGSVSGGASNNAAWAAHQSNNPNPAYPPSAPAQPGYGNPAAGNPPAGNPGMPPAGNQGGGNPWPPPGFGGPDGTAFTAPTEQQNYIPPSGGPQGQPFTPPPAPAGGYPPAGTYPPNGFPPPAGNQPAGGYPPSGGYQPPNGYQPPPNQPPPGTYPNN